MVRYTPVVLISFLRICSDRRLISYIPNLLTFLRAAAAPALIVLLEDKAYALALLLFMLAGISDGLDGYIAKRYRCKTRLGAILDPVADKVLLISAFVMLTIQNLLPLWLLVTIVFRDGLIVCGYLVLVTLNGSVQMRPSLLSKFNTVLQITLVAGVLVQQARWVDVSTIVETLVVGVFATTAVSGVHYVWFWAFGKHSDVAAKPETSGG